MSTVNFQLSTVNFQLSYSKVFSTPNPIKIFDNPGDFFAEPAEDAALINSATVIYVGNVRVPAKKSGNTNVSIPVTSVDNVLVLKIRIRTHKFSSSTTFVSVHVLSVENVTVPVHNLGDTNVTFVENTSNVTFVENTSI